MFLHAFSIALAITAIPMLRTSNGEDATLPEIGPHQRILVVKKNVNPQNLLVVYTKEDGKGRFVADPNRGNGPVLDFYWLMDGKKYKPVHRLIKGEIGKRFRCHAGAENSATHFTVDVNDLKEVDSDIRNPKIDVYASGSGEASEVEARMNLGPSDGNMRIRLSSIYTEGRAFPPAVYSVTLEGEEIVNGRATGRKITRKYEGKN